MERADWIAAVKRGVSQQLKNADIMAVDRKSTAFSLAHRTVVMLVEGDIAMLAPSFTNPGSAIQPTEKLRDRVEHMEVTSLQGLNDDTATKSINVIVGHLR